MTRLRFAAPCLMGVERLLSNELKYIGCENVCADNGRVFFEGDERTLVRANLRSRIAERILLVCARFEAKSFEELFNGTKRARFPEYLPADAAFPVTGSCLSSQLKSVPDCQRIIKKAIVESMKKAYGVSGQLPESGSVYKVRFLILKDQVCLMIDTTGEPLHKRGYRANANGAPMKETLAAAIVELSRVRRDHTVIDPCCGSGTIVIEAAQKALNIAPGIKRAFAAEQWSLFPEKMWREERELAKSEVRTDCTFRGIGYDIDEQALEIARENARLAGVADRVTFKNRDLRDFSEDMPRATVICNPPYGERLLDVMQAEELFSVMGERFVRRDGWSYSIICPDDDFERCFRRRADKRRKLYNGMLSCQLYQYYK